MRLILARSLDGYLARNPKDDMAWTGQEDKRVFRLLTQVGGRCYAGQRSWEQMPNLQGRKVFPVSRRSEYAQNAPRGSVEKTVTLGQAFHQDRDAWLLGGPTLAMEALSIDMVDQVFMVTAPVVLFETSIVFRAAEAIRDKVTPWLASRGEMQNAGIPWRQDQSIQLSGGTTVDCWSCQDYARRSQS